MSAEKSIASLSRAEVRGIILAHLEVLYAFYGEDTGVRIARKHLGWYFARLSDSATLRASLMAAATTASQFAAAKKSSRWVGRDEGACSVGAGLMVRVQPGISTHASKEEKSRSQGVRGETERQGSAVAQSCRAGSARLLHEPERPPAGAALRHGVARSRRAAVQGGARLRGGNQSRAAGILGINRGTLRKKLRQFGLSAEPDRPRGARVSDPRSPRAAFRFRQDRPGRARARARASAASRFSPRAARRSCWRERRHRRARKCRATRASPRSWMGA